MGRSVCWGLQVFVCVFVFASYYLLIPLLLESKYIVANVHYFSPNVFQLAYEWVIEKK
jgi:hypothetical protein